MPEADFEAILRKYKSLAGANAPARSSPRQQGGSSGRPAPGSSSTSPAKSPLVDSFLDDGQFVTPALSRAPQEQAGRHQRRLGVLYSGVFDTFHEDVFKTTWTPQEEALFQRPGDFSLLLTSQLAGHSQDSGLDLRDCYCPALGLYPAQAICQPAHRPAAAKRKVPGRPKECS